MDPAKRWTEPAIESDSLFTDELQKRWTAPPGTSSEYDEESEALGDYHPFHTVWCVWCSFNHDELKCIHTMDGLGDLWSYWESLRKSFETLKECSLRFFREGLDPGRNDDDRRWILRKVPADAREKLWMVILMGTVAEDVQTNHRNPYLQGVSFVARPEGDTVEVWVDPIGVTTGGDPPYSQFMHGLSETLNVSPGFQFETAHGIFPRFNQGLIGGLGGATALTSTVFNKPAKQKSWRVFKKKEPKASESTPHVMPSQEQIEDSPLQPEKVKRTNSEDARYRKEKVEQLEEFLKHSEDNPGQYSKREIRNSRRQLSMLLRRAQEDKASYRAPDTASSVHILDTL